MTLLEVIDVDQATLWHHLLGHAWRWNPHLYHALRAAQVIGCELAEGHGKASLTAGQADPEKWRHIRTQHLEPQRALLTDLLRRTMTEDPDDAPKDQPTPYDQDPRPEITEDHELWVAALTTAWYDEDKGPFWALLNTRGCGAGMKRDDQGRLQMIAGRVGPQLWRDLREEFLGPHKEGIARVLLRASLGTEASPEEAARVAARFAEQERANQQRLAL